MSRTLDGIFAVLLVVWTALWVAFWRASFWLVRLAWRHRRVIPYIDVILAGLGALILAKIIGDTPAFILTAAAAAAAWFLRDSIRFRLKWSHAIKRFGLDPVRVDRIEETPAGKRVTVTYAKSQHAGYLERHTSDLVVASGPAMPHVFDRCQVTLTHLRPADYGGLFEGPLLGGRHVQGSERAWARAHLEHGTARGARRAAGQRGTRWREERSRGGDQSR